MANLYEGLENVVDQVPEFAQPLVVAGLGMVPYIEGEGSAALGIIVGINPVVAALAGAAGNILSVLAVVYVSSRVRETVVSRRAPVDTAESNTDTVASSPVNDAATPTRRAKGKKRLDRWLVKYGVPGASLIAPLALPTQLTAAFFVASGIEKKRVFLWQVVAIALWTGVIAAAALGITNLLGLS